MFGEKYPQVPVILGSVLLLVGSVAVFGQVPQKQPGASRDLRLERLSAEDTKLPASSSSVKGVRRALLVGNSAYQHVTPLKNPRNDVAGMAERLTAYGFEVTLIRDANLKGLSEAVAAFVQKSALGGLDLFYFSGHGAQVGGDNYLVPVDFRYTSETAIQKDCLSARKIQDAMEQTSTATRVLVFDACRNNPFRREGGRRGLAPMDSRLGTVIAFSTGPGQVADDNPIEKNGLYTKYLLETMDKHLDLVSVFRTTRELVHTASSGRQSPWFHEDLIQSVSLSGRSVAADVPAGAAVSREIIDGLAFYVNGNHRAAIEKFEQAVRVRPDDPYVHNALGAAYSGAGFLNPAIDRFSRAIGLKRDYAAAYYNRGLAYMKSSKFEMAAEDFSWAIDGDARNSVLFLLRARANFGLLEWDRALADLARAVELNPHDAVTHYYRAACLNRQGKYSEAMQAASEALSISPGFCEALKAREYARRGAQDAVGAATDRAKIATVCAVQQ